MASKVPPLDLSSLRAAVASFADALAVVDSPAFRYKELFRLGFERGLVADVESWFDFRDLRNVTAHTYERQKANAVAQRAPALWEHATDLLRRLEMRNHG